MVVHECGYGVWTKVRAVPGLKPPVQVAGVGSVQAREDAESAE